MNGMPVGLLNARLRVLAPVHNAHSANVVGSFGQLLTNCVSCALVDRLIQMCRPPILEIVERWLPVEREHGDGVGGVHAVSQELDAEAGRGRRLLGRRGHSFRDS